MSNDWLPNHVHGKDHHTQPDRRPLYFFLGSAAVLFLVVAILFFQHMINSGRGLAERPGPSVTATAGSGEAGSSGAGTGGTGGAEAGSGTASGSPTTEPSPSATLQRPAPEGAISAAAFTTPAKNIHCRINSDNAECSIYTYSYPSPGQCEGKTATYSVGHEGPVEAGCTYSVETPEVLDYGTAVAMNGFACTLEQNGVTCWSEASGHGFELARSADRLF